MGIKTSGGGTGLKKQTFISTAGQIVFSVTDLTLTDAFLVIVNDMPQTSATRVGQDITIPGGVADESTVVIFG